MQEFSAKRDALFACLDNASKELRGTALDQSNIDGRAGKALKRSLTVASTLEEDNIITETEMTYRRGGRRRSGSTQSNDISLSHLRGKESIFKKPELPIGRCLKPRQSPDYQINPHKWKKYSLSDVDISDHTNTSAAFAFLKQMDEQREAHASDADPEGGTADQKIEFKKSSKIRRNLDAIKAKEVADVECDKPKMRGSKVLMPEYVVGQKREKPRNTKIPKDGENKRAAGTLTLSHLQEQDDEEG